MGYNDHGRIGVRGSVATDTQKAFLSQGVCRVFGTALSELTRKASHELLAHDGGSDRTEPFRVPRRAVPYRPLDWHFGLGVSETWQTVSGKTVGICRSVHYGHIYNNASTVHSHSTHRPLFLQHHIFDKDVGRHFGCLAHFQNSRETVRVKSQCVRWKRKLRYACPLS